MVGRYTEDVSKRHGPGRTNLGGDERGCTVSKRPRILLRIALSSS